MIRVVHACRLLCDRVNDFPVPFWPVVRAVPTDPTPITPAILQLMKFRALQDNLRKILLDRIDSGELTGLRLAQQTGFKQAHISNFLNRKRGLSLEGMDKVLSVQHLCILDLLDPADVDRRASILPPSPDEYENVLLTDPYSATQARITADRVLDILKFKKTFLRNLKAETVGDRSSWQRFVLIRLDPSEAVCMAHRLSPGATLLIDRHYNSLEPYHKNDSPMYAVLKNDRCTVRYVELAEKGIVLRPHNRSCPIELLPIPSGKSPTDLVIGRVCQYSQEG